MNRVLTLGAAVLAAFVLLVPVALAAEPFDETGRILIATPSTT